MITILVFLLLALVIVGYMYRDKIACYIPIDMEKLRKALNRRQCEDSLKSRSVSEAELDVRFSHLENVFMQEFSKLSVEMRRMSTMIEQNTRQKSGLSNNGLTSIERKQEQLYQLMMQIQQNMLQLEKKTGMSVARDQLQVVVGDEPTVMRYNNLIYCGLPHNGIFAKIPVTKGAERYMLEVGGEARFSIIEEHSLSMLESFQFAVSPVCKVVEGNVNSAHRMIMIEKGRALLTEAGWKVTQPAKIKLI